MSRSEFQKCRKCGTTNRLKPEKQTPAGCGMCGYPLIGESYYEILGVTREAPTQEIRRAYKRLVLEWHPDKHKDGTFAIEFFKLIREAYEVLSNPQNRLDYDLKVQTQAGPKQQASATEATEATADRHTKDLTKKEHDADLWIQLSVYMAIFIMAVVGFVVWSTGDPSGEHSLWFIQVLSVVFVGSTVHFICYLMTGKTLWKYKG